MTPEEIIAILQDYFKDRMDKEIDIVALGDAFTLGDPKDKQSLIEELELFDV